MNVVCRMCCAVIQMDGRMLTRRVHTISKPLGKGTTSNIKNVLTERLKHISCTGSKGLVRNISTSMLICGSNHHNNNNNMSPVLDPIEKLQKFVAVPILSESDRVFRPTRDEIIKGQSLFLPSLTHRIEFLKSAMLDEHLPQYELPEVAFIGRSNVGKSSLIKILLEEADEEVRVRCSKTPGHTKLMNFFQVGKAFTLVDMPGYGYRMPKHYVESVENFISTRKKLNRVLMLIDGSIGVTQTDIVGLNMIEEFCISYCMTFLLIDGKFGMTSTDEEHLAKVIDMNVKTCIVLTKIDKARPAVILKNLMKVQSYMKKLPHCTRQPFLISSTAGDGVAMLQSFIAYVTGNLAVEDVG